MGKLRALDNVLFKDVRQHYTDEQKIAGCAVLKFVRYTTSMLDAKRKKEAYEKLMNNDFDLPEEDEAWKVIDESPAFYEDIRGKKLLSELGLQDTFHLVPNGPLGMPFRTPGSKWCLMTDRLTF